MAASRERFGQYELVGVQTTERMLGRGSYGWVMEVRHKDTVYAAKKMHDFLFEEGEEGTQYMTDKYYRECELMSSLHHPNITQFMGVCFIPNEDLPLLVMEKLEMNLDTLLESVANLLLPLKVSILEDVSCGLNFLHTRNPMVIHRDLTAKNVLLTSSLMAKISDMGNSRIVVMTPEELVRTLSRVPGTLVYMPPEATNSTHRYGPSLDIFSFGHLALFTLIQDFPGNLLEPTYDDPTNPERLSGRTEVERRQTYMDQLQRLDRPSLIEIVNECLQNSPDKRPSSEQLLRRIHAIREEVDCLHGGRAARLFDVWRVSLANEAKERDVREKKTLQEDIKKLKRQLEEKDLKFKKELDEKNKELQEKTITEQKYLKLLTESQVKIAQLERHIEQMEHRGQDLQQENVENLENLRLANIKIEEQQQGYHCIHHMLQQKTKELEHQLQLIGGELHSRTEKMDSALAAVEKSFTQLNMKYDCEEVKHKVLERPQDRSSPSKVLEIPLKIMWEGDGQSMPYKMGGYIQSVIIQDTIYIGGGNVNHSTSHSSANFIVMAFNMRSQKWHKLQSNGTCGFSLVAINDQPAVVGGVGKRHCASNQVGVWEIATKKWTRPYKPMPTSRSHASAVVYKHWLVVAGGKSEHKTSNVEILDISANQWVSTSPIPELWSSMKSALVGDTWYLMGGFDSKGTATDEVHKVHMPDLLFYSGSSSPVVNSLQIWSTIAPLECHSSAPVCVAGTLLAVGGISNKAVTVTPTIYCYNSGTNTWIKSGELKGPRSQCCCAVSSEGKLAVVGGQDIAGGQDITLCVGLFMM